MKKTVLIVFCLFFLCSCSYYSARREKLPPDSGSADLARTQSGYGKIPRPEDFEKPFKFTASVSVFKYVTEKHSEGPPSLLNTYPTLSVIKNEETSQKILSYIKERTNEYDRELSEMTLPQREGRETSTEATRHCSAQIVSDYLCLTEYESYNFTTYKRNSKGASEYDKNDVVSGLKRSNSVFDLHTGEKLTLADLFYDDVKPSDILSPKIAVFLEDTAFDGLKRPFDSISDTYENISLSHNGYLIVHFPQNNPYTVDEISVYVPFWELRESMYLPETDRTLFIDGAFEPTKTATYADELFERIMVNTDLLFLKYPLPDRDKYIEIQNRNGENDALAAINKRIDELNSEVLESDVWKKAKKYDDFDLEYTFAASSNIVSVYINSYCTLPDEDYAFHSFIRLGTFDIKTGKELFLSDIILSKEKCIAHLRQLYPDIVIADDLFKSTPLFLNYENNNILFEYDGQMRVILRDSGVLNMDIYKNID